MLDGRAPYKALLTHGFVVDGQGRKMSKSLGNVVVPQKVADSLGAEILRLWVASTDYSGELSLSDEILKRVVESYRRIRNTLRFLLANTSDFDPEHDALPMASLSVIDRYAIAMAARTQDIIADAYEQYDFHTVVSTVQGFCTEDLGGFWLDVLKDRLYTTRLDSRARRSARTGLQPLPCGPPAPSRTPQWPRPTRAAWRRPRRSPGAHPPARTGLSRRPCGPHHHPQLRLWQRGDRAGRRLPAQ
jgi:isoleucyl-tRNA synthetase